MSAGVEVGAGAVEYTDCVIAAHGAVAPIGFADVPDIGAVAVVAESDIACPIAAAVVDVVAAAAVDVVAAAAFAAVGSVIDADIAAVGEVVAVVVAVPVMMHSVYWNC